MQIKNKHYVEVKAVNGRGVLNTDIFNYKLETEDGEKIGFIEIINRILEDNEKLHQENNKLKEKLEKYQFTEDKTDNLLVSSLDLLQKKVTRLELKVLKEEE